MSAYYICRVYNDNVVRGVMSRVIYVVQLPPCLIIHSMNSSTDQITVIFATTDDGDLSESGTDCLFTVKLTLPFTP